MVSGIIVLRSMKSTLRRALQRTLGLEAYLLAFAVYRVAASPVDPRDRAFRRFLRLVPRDALALDIGANVGATTIALAGRARAVHAFEPVEIHAACIRRLLRLLRQSRVTVHKTALGRSAGDIEMVLPESAGAILPGLARVADSSLEGRRVSVPCTTLDSLPYSLRGRVGAIKIDVEDFESEVLEGGRYLIERDRPVILAELWRTPNRARTLCVLGNLGYDCLVLDATGSLVAFDPERHEHWLDFFFLPAERS